MTISRPAVPSPFPRSLRRRFSCVAAVALLTAGCSWGYHYASFQARDAVVESRSGEPTYVAWYHGGEILGAEAAADPEFPYLDWVRKYDGEVRDHPRLPAWRQQLGDLRVCAGGDGGAPELVRRARDFPFTGAVEDVMAQWIGERGDRAAELLDRGGSSAVRHEFAAQLVTRATADTAVDDARASRWVHDLARSNHADAVIALLGSPPAGAATARATLAELHDLPSRHRVDVFDAAAARLQDDPLTAGILVRAASDLPSSQSAGAMAALLARSASVAFAREVLQRLDDVRTADRAELFRRAAPLVHADPRDHDLIVRAVSDLRSSERLPAMLDVTRFDGVSAELMIRLVERVDELPSRDRDSLLRAVLRSPCGGDEGVRDTCRRAVRQLPSSRRDDLLRLLDGS